MMWNTKISKLTAVFTSIFFAGFVCIYPLHAIADEPDKKIVTLKIGDPAPFAGTLFSTAAAADLAIELENKETQCKIQKDKATELLSAEHKLKIDLKSAEFTALQFKYDQILQIKNDQISFLESKIKPPAWWEAGEFWVAIGLVAGIGLTVASAYAIGQTN